MKKRKQKNNRCTENKHKKGNIEEDRTESEITGKN